ncbi:hypothetical protein DMUE_2577 [Dictyocoela muelleri]|nr:hypothetical protein DMUE_2577 [Dictyocoela muelleri]
MLSRETNHANKKNSINIFTNFIKYGHPQYVDHGILNSRPNGQKISMEIESLIDVLDTHKMKHIQVDCKIQNTDILIKRDLPIFETLSSDLFKGIQSFRNTVRLTDWSSKP